VFSTFNKKKLVYSCKKYRIKKHATKGGDGFHCELLYKKTAMVEGLCASIIYSNFVCVCVFFNKHKLYTIRPEILRMT